jgi:hypothetical protein
MDPFESSSMVHSGATGLVGDWRTKIVSPYGTASPRFMTLNLRTPGRNASPQSPISSTSMTRMSTPSPLSVRCGISCVFAKHSMSMTQFKETPSLPTFTLSRMVNGSRVNPGIKDLPAHIRQNFRNEFIRFVIKQVANSKLPWANPDLEALQAMYQVVYPVFPARLRHSDAVYHPVSDSLTAILQNSDIERRPSRHLGSSVTTSPLPLSLQFIDTCPTSSERKGFKPLMRGQNTLPSSLDQMTTTRSSGVSMLKAISRTIPKSVDTRRYAKFVYYFTSCSESNVLCRPDAVYSNRTRSWKRFWATTLHPVSWSPSQPKTQHPETDR